MKKDYLLSKSDGVKDCVKYIEKIIKQKNSSIDEDFYSCDYKVINELVELKISLEKYSKKLKHQANEL